MEEERKTLQRDVRTTSMKIRQNANNQEAQMELKQFLIHAKLNSYSTGKESLKLPDGRKEFRVEADGFTYQDQYIGENPFVGQEIVWHAGQVVWGMNFYGRVVSDIVPAEQIYTFLQKAMRQIKEERPFRGPDTFNEHDFAYCDESQGTVEGFMGVERILYQGQEVYRLDYHGGSVTTV